MGVMSQGRVGETNRRLGYPADARLLIINADDFGMCHAISAGVARTLTAGIAQSTTLMVPCPWALQAMAWLGEHPAIPFGVHLTVLSDAYNYRWGPLSPRDNVPSLLNDAGGFHDFEHMPQLLAEANPAELEREFRAQIEAVLAAGLTPTHLDWHSLRLQGRNAIFDLMLRLAREYGLALRVRGQSWIDHVQSLGLPAADYDFLDSSMVPTPDKPARYAQLLHELPVGLSEWAVHPGVENDELRAIEPTSNGFRQADLDFLTSSEAPDIVAREGIILLSYAPLQVVWQTI